MRGHDSPQTLGTDAFYFSLKDGTKILSAGADKAGRMFDVQTGQSSQIAAHDAPIKCLRWIDFNGGILATGSWDKTVKVSDEPSIEAMSG